MKKSCILFLFSKRNGIESKRNDALQISASFYRFWNISIGNSDRKKNFSSFVRLFVICLITCFSHRYQCEEWNAVDSTVLKHDLMYRWFYFPLCLHQISVWPLCAATKTLKMKRENLVWILWLFNIVDITFILHNKLIQRRVWLTDTVYYILYFIYVCTLWASCMTFIDRYKEMGIINTTHRTNIKTLLSNCFSIIIYK